MRIALVYDWVNTIGGAERILVELHKLYPYAPLYTTVHDKSLLWTKNIKIITSFLQKIPYSANHHYLFPYLTPLAFESFDLSKFDVVISIAAYDSKGIITKPGTLHISYMLTPTRYLWSHQNYYFRNRILRILRSPIIKHLKKWDLASKNRPDFIISISKTTKERIKRFYNLDSEVVYPPVCLVDKAKNIKKSRANFFLLVSRLVPYKRVDIAIKAFNRLKMPLYIIGKGRAESRLKSIAGSTIKFLGNLTETQLISYYQNCRAVIITSEEDFGIVSVEAQAFGKPVIAFAKGGSQETVKEYITGVYFQTQDAYALMDIISKFDSYNFSEKSCIENSRKFSSLLFKNKFKSTVDSYIKKYFNL